MRNQPSTLIELLQQRAADAPGRTAFTWLTDGESQGISVTFGQLESRARAIGARLQELRAAGERVLLAFPTGLDFIAAFFGCQFAGAVAVPAPLPLPRRPPTRTLSILGDARPVAILTSSNSLAEVRLLGEANGSPALPPSLAVDDLDSSLAESWRPPDCEPHALACLQYTSGSTRTPAGVMLTHDNILKNLAMIVEFFGADASTQNVSWLPFHHDMGLLGGLLATVYSGGQTTILSPTSFLQQPIRWLRAITRAKGTHSGGPNFAYDLCARAIRDEQLDGLDLRSWRVAYNGAEPIHPATLERFATRFEPCGFSRAAFLPCYGLAEASLFVTGRRGVWTAFVGARSGTDAPGDGADAPVPSRVSCGPPLAGQKVVIVDPETGRCCENAVGEVWVSGPSVARGYWNRPAETRDTFQARLPDDNTSTNWLRTGDLGQLSRGELFVTGRLKDLIIIRGENHYPQDIEATVAGCHAALDPAWAAAFAVDDGGEERLVVVHEVRREERKTDPGPVLSAIRAAIAERHELEVAAILLVGPGVIPRTSSGKVQRGQCRRNFLDGVIVPLAEWRDATPKAATEPATERDSGRQGSEAPAPGQTADDLATWLRATLAERIKISPEALDADEPFARYGLDSAAVVGIAGELEARLGRRLSPTLLYEYPTISALSRHLAAGAGPDPGRAPHAAPLAAGDSADAAIGIVGIACRFPGASGPAEFWKLLCEGRDAIRQAPARDWTDSENSNGDAPADPPALRWGGFLDAVDGFDAAFFGIAPREATTMDPQQRLLLEVAWESLEDAVTPPHRLRGSDTGVFMGLASNDYGRLALADAEACDLHSSTGNALSIAANRLSYVFDFHGPSLVVDTACSSSLVAVHLACQSLASGECRVALAGGANLLLSRTITSAFANARFLAPDGRCKAFDARADGYVRGEGIGVVVLKPLAAAVAAGDRIYAVIRGTAVNQGGRANGLTAPNPHAQEAVVRAASLQAGVAPGMLQYVEAHGTGTALGDPIEARALGAVLHEGRSPGTRCVIGSAKTNIGHLEAAAGVAGLIKTALMIFHRTIVPSLHFDAPNPLIPFDELPLEVARAAGTWPRTDKGILAGVSSFGFGGTNAHAVLAEAPAASPGAGPSPARPGRLVLPISARSPQALRELAARYREQILQQNGAAAEFQRLCRAAALRRDHHPHRLAIAAATGDECAAQLEAWLKQPENGRDPGRTADKIQDIVRRLTQLGAGGGAELSDTNHETLAREYEAGAEIHWDAVYGSSDSSVALPSYPWQHRRYWIEHRGLSEDSIILPPPSVGEGRGVGGASVGLPTPILTFPQQGGRNLPLHSRLDIGTGPDTPALEHYLRERIAASLGFAPAEIDADQSLTELGLDSLMAVELTNGMARELGIKVPFAELLDGVSLAALLQKLSTAAAGEAREGAAPSPPDRLAEAAPSRESRPQSAEPSLSLPQERLWLLAELASLPEVLNIPAAVRLAGQLNVAALERSLTEVVRRHESLRAVVRTCDDRVFQVFQQPHPVALHVLHLSPMPARERHEEALRLLTEAARRPFDHARGPLFSATLIRLADDEHCLLISISHLVCDGWSMRVLFREIASLYSAFAAGLPSPLAELPAHYADFAAWQRRRLRDESFQDLVAHWKTRLGICPPALTLPTDRPRPLVQTYRGARRFFELPAALSTALAELARKQGATLYMVLLAAFETLLGRCSGQETFFVGTPSAGRTRPDTDELIGVFLNLLPLKADLGGNPTFLELLDRVRSVALEAYRHQDVPFEALLTELRLHTDPSRAPLFQVLFDLQEADPLATPLPSLTAERIDLDTGASMLDLSLYVTRTAGNLRGHFEYNTDLFDSGTIDLMVERLETLLSGIAANPATPLSGLTVLSANERRRLLGDWNDTAVDLRSWRCIHAQFEDQVERTPDAVALVFRDRELTYRDLNARANQVAHRLSRHGVGPDALVGICIERSLEMVVGILGILKSGAAYVPVDPSYPRERQALILEDSQVAVVLTQKLLERRLPQHLTIIPLDASHEHPAHDDERNLASSVSPDHLAYVLYTSGSTGFPKGVMVTHRNVANFFAGMNALHADEPPGVWLAVTTISFDISVLEQLWTLTRGFRVVIQPEQTAPPLPVDLAPARPEMQFSLFYFECDEQQGHDSKYRLVLEGARFADDHGFTAVWTPERHFHPFGGLYSNPSVVGAAVAAVTRHVGVRAGSVVLPLNNPVRVAEEWSVVDNLSQGRVGVAFAPGSHPNDFVLAPDVYGDRKAWMLREIETVRKLWRGETVRLRGGSGDEVEVRIFPRPVQPELPGWLTAIGADSFRIAGERGLNVLSHLLFHDVRELTEKIVAYRQARRQHGHAGPGHVTLMVHTFVGRTMNDVRETVREPLSEYLRSSADMFVKLGLAGKFKVDPAGFSDDDREAFVEHAFERFFDFNALFGTPESCAGMIETLQAIGVDEVACLIDFGVDFATVMNGLRLLAEVRDRGRAARSHGASLPADEASFSAVMLKHGVTHLQCTPAMARMLLSERDAADALRALRRLYVGGDTLPPTLAAQLAKRVGEVWNMYGPTETTIWSTTTRGLRLHPGVTVGRPIANTQLYVLDRDLRPAPVGVPGELFIAGAGVARGYFHRPELTQERFLSDPFSSDSQARMYRTGDLVRYRGDGALEHLGRLDHQVKIRGHRIELGEIESRLTQDPAVREAAVVARTDPSGEKQLAAFVVAAPGTNVALENVRLHLRRHLPDYMIPSTLAVVESLPLTPNGKIDRRALTAWHAESAPPASQSAPSTACAMDEARAFVPPVAAAPVEFVPWRTATERTLVQLWRGVLEIDRQIGLYDNFFALGGHSLQAVMLVGRIREMFRIELSLRDFFATRDLAALATMIDAAAAAGGRTPEAVAAL
jgi:natural product biosynthesis luciferase-like monooxygenase protein